MTRESVKGKEQGQVASQEAPESKTVASRPAGANDSIAGLHRGAGNRAVASLLAPSSGGPLDRGTREEMESKFGADFGGVRVHRDENAAKTALAAGARAITTGRDITFGPGFYDPGSREGKKLIGHELAHVMQQRQGGHTLSRAAAETEARQAGADVAAGRIASVHGAASAGVQADPMNKEEIQKKIAELEDKATRASGKEIDELFRQREALQAQLRVAEALPSNPQPQSAPPAPKPDVSVRDVALEVGARELDKPSWQDFSFPRKPSRPRDLTSVRLIVRQGTPMRKSVAITHWRSRAEVEQFMNDYISVADEDPATKPLADQARQDRKLILDELTNAEEDVLAGRMKLAAGQQHVEDVKARLRVQTPEGLKPTVGVGQAAILTVEFVDELANFIPYVGEIKMALEGVTGMTISGQLNKAIYAPGQLGTADLDTFDRIIRIIPIAISAASKIVSKAPGWAEALAKLRKGTNLSEQALETALRDTAQLAGREKQVARALLALKAERQAAQAARLEEFAGLKGAKPVNDVVLPTEPKSNVIPLRPKVVQQAEEPLARAAGHDVQGPGAERTVAGSGGKGGGRRVDPPRPEPSKTPSAKDPEYWEKKYGEESERPRPPKRELPKRERISDANKTELQESDWLKRHLPDVDNRRKFMKWLESAHKQGEEHVHLRPGSPEAEAALKRWMQEEGRLPKE